LRTQVDPGRIASWDMDSLEKDLDFKTPRRKHAQRTPPTWLSKQHV
jgi:hypothetical protein